MVVVNRYINIGRVVDGKQETIDLVPGQEAPDWVAERLSPAMLGDPRDALAEEDQFLTALRQTATSEGIKWDDDWDKDHLTQAITAVRQAAVTHTPLDMRQFGPRGQAVGTSGSAEPDAGSEPGDTGRKPADEMSPDELKAEHVRLLGDEPHHSLSETNLRKRVAEAQTKEDQS